LQTISGARLPGVPLDHDRLEIAITIVWKRWSRCSGMGDHDGLERMITIVWNHRSRSPGTRTI